MYRKSYLRILKAVCLCALLQIICNFHNIDNELDFIHREMHYKKCLKSDSQESNLPNKFLHQDETPDDTTEIPKIKPIMHTFVQYNADYVDRKLLDYWAKAWTGAGWEVRMLTPKDAVSYTHYKEFNAELQRNKICCLPRNTYLRHLAMSTVKEGGFYSEAHAFPLRDDLVVQQGQNIPIPNQGNFTSWDGIQGSILSGSYEEWNRMTEVLMKKIKKNAVLSFMEISDESCDTYRHENLIADPTLLLSGKQFNKKIICTEFENYLALRFHPYEIVRAGIDIKERYSIVSSWYEIYNARCVSENPAMFTIFDKLDDEPTNEKLEVWKQSWSEAGLEPVVLTDTEVKYFGPL